MIKRLCSGVGRGRQCTLRPEGDTLDIDQLDARWVVNCVRGGERLRHERSRSDRFAVARCHVEDCGSGVTACTLALAAELAGYRDKAVYDGSFSEWGLPSPRPVVSE